MRTKEDIRQELNVSYATINNWIKTGLIPDEKYFNDITYDKIIANILTTNQKLQRRANRSHNSNIIARSSTIKDQQTLKTIEILSTYYQDWSVTIDAFMFLLSLYSLKKNALITITGNTIQSSNHEFTDFLNSWKLNCKIDIKEYFPKFNDIVYPDSEVDFLGSTYEYLRTIKDKSEFGAFFTPQKLIQDIVVPVNASILDPCSGTGSILLSIVSKKHNPKNVNLRDIDELALKIAKVNFVIFFNSVNAIVNTQLKNILFDKSGENISDLFSSDQSNEEFDFIITNPPYGAKLQAQEKKLLIREYSQLNTTESFSIALFNSLSKLSDKGKLYFILPESILYVDTHFKIRKYLFDKGYKIKITHFGNAFRGVQSKIIRLEIENSHKANNKTQIVNGKIQWTVPKDLLIKNEYRPPLISAIQEMDILQKVMHSDSFYLANHCVFGLGIVTGNNNAYLSSKPLNDNYEPIYTGKELKKFGFSPPQYYMHFQPEILQQVAPAQLYRKDKICYRFISNDIITVADLNGSLILNSINFLIPDKDIPIKALSSLLNAPLISFLYKRLFNSTKVLRKHIESFPIPNAFFQKQDELKQLYDEAVAGKAITERLNTLCCKLYGLNDTETNYIMCKK